MVVHEFEAPPGIVSPPLSCKSKPSISDCRHDTKYKYIDSGSVICTQPMADSARQVGVKSMVNVIRDS